LRRRLEGQRAGALVPGDVPRGAARPAARSSVRRPGGVSGRQTLRKEVLGLAPGVSLPKRRMRTAHPLLKKRNTMDDKEKRREAAEESERAAEDAGAPQGSGALIEPPEEAVARLERELGDLKDKYLRLAAEYDNFRKRALKERTEAWEKAQGDLVLRLVDALDDLARFAHVDPATTDAKTIHDGVDLVERKIWKELETLGVRRLDETGVRFDPAVHEAVTVAPAASPEQDNTVGQVLQAGYRLGGQLIRPARVLVLKWQERSEPEAERGGEQGGEG